MKAESMQLFMISITQITKNIKDVPFAPNSGGASPTVIPYILYASYEFMFHDVTAIQKIAFVYFFFLSAILLTGHDIFTSNNYIGLPLFRRKLKFYVIYPFCIVVRNQTTILFYFLTSLTRTVIFRGWRNGAKMLIPVLLLSGFGLDKSQRARSALISKSRPLQG